MFKQALCEVVLPLLTDCITGMKTVTDWGKFPLLTIVKENACKPSIKQYQLKMLNGNL